MKFVSLFAMLALCVPLLFAQSPAPKEPEELVRLRQAYKQKRADALKPIDASYRTQLEMLVRSLTSRNQLDAAILVRKELTMLAETTGDEGEFRKALLESKWSWAGVKDEFDLSVQMVFLDDGTVSHRGMHGTWKITAPHEVKLVQNDATVRILKFDEAVQSYRQTNEPDRVRGKRLP